MPDLAPGLPITIRATVHKVCAKGDVCAEVSNGYLFVPPDAIEGVRRVRFGDCRSAEGTVLCQHNDYLVVVPDANPMPIVQHRDWCEEIKSDEVHA